MFPARKGFRDAEINVGCFPECCQLLSEKEMKLCV
jgi:hypothetical protein